MDRKKDQGDAVPSPADAGPGVIVSPDTQRQNRIPAGQSRPKRWPVLDAGGPPKIDLDTWKLRMFGLVNQPVEWNWREFLALPRVKVFSDFHCVTRWSRLGNVWEGVSTRELLVRSGGAASHAGFVLAHGYDRGFTTNLPLADFLADLLAEDALVAITHDGEPFSADHGGPARLIIPRLYAWKSAKWLTGIELIPADRLGFWESNGYHMRGDPWTEQQGRNNRDGTTGTEQQGRNNATAGRCGTTTTNMYNCRVVIRGGCPWSSQEEISQEEISEKWRCRRCPPRSLYRLPTWRWRYPIRRSPACRSASSPIASGKVLRSRTSLP